MYGSYWLSTRGSGRPRGAKLAGQRECRSTCAQCGPADSQFAVAALSWKHLCVSNEKSAVSLDVQWVQGAYSYPFELQHLFTVGASVVVSMNTIATEPPPSPGIAKRRV